jgi:pyrroline-5-carboxylate reductase
MKNLVIIGGGNMGSAIAKSVANSNDFDITVVEKDQDKLNNITVKGCTEIGEIEFQPDIVILAVKPQSFPEVLPAVASKFSNSDTVFVSIAAGITIATIENSLGKNAKIIRAMPNLPALIGAGATALSPNKNVTSQEMNTALDIFRTCGEAIDVPEDQMDTVVAISGSSPAYAFMLIDAMIKSGIQAGLPKETAEILAKQAVLGSAQLAKNSEDSPEELCKKVCSPGGTTIEAVKILEDKKFADTINTAMIAVSDRSKELAKN